MSDWWLAPALQKWATMSPASFNGTLFQGTSEGEVFWLPIKDLKKVKLAEGFDQEIELFEDNNNVTEIYSDNIMGLNYKKY